MLLSCTLDMISVRSSYSSTSSLSSRNTPCRPSMNAICFCTTLWREPPTCSSHLLWDRKSPMLTPQTVKSLIFTHTLMHKLIYSFTNFSTYTSLQEVKMSSTSSMSLSINANLRASGKRLNFRNTPKAQRSRAEFSGSGT